MRRGRGRATRNGLGTWSGWLEKHRLERMRMKSGFERTPRTDGHASLSSPYLNMFAVTLIGFLKFTG